MNHIKTIIAWRGYFPIYFIVYAGINVLILNMPLLSVFSYEFTAANSFLLIIFSGLYTIGFLKLHFTKINLAVLKEAIIPLLFLTTLPLGFGIYSHFFIMSCSLGDGLLFYLTLTMPGVVIGAGLASLSYSVLNKFTRLLFFIIIFVIAIIPISEIYFNPQIYFYTPLIGYFPGNIYDEGLSTNLKLTIYRLLNFIFFSGLLFSSIIVIRSRKMIYKIILPFVAILLSVLFIVLSPQLGFSSSISSIRKELNKTIETENFIIYYSDNIEEKDIEYAALLHEYYFTRLEEFFGEKPSTKTVTFLFDDRPQKKMLFGAGAADVAKPWLNQIYISFDGYDRTLKHELAHCFSAVYGAGLFKLAENFNPFLIEGIAEAADPFFDDHEIHFLASVAYNNGYKINFEQMFSGIGFFMNTSSLSYTYAGSFVKFLLENYGNEKFRQFYLDADLSKIYGNGRKVIRDYIHHLESFNTRNRNGMADYYFGRKSIFRKVCPRYTAEKIAEGYKLFSLGKIIEARSVFESVLSVSENYQAVAGLAECLIEQDSVLSAINLLDSYKNSFKGTSYYANLLLKSGDYQALAGNNEKAVSYYSEIRKINPSRLYFFASGFRLKLADNPDKLINYIEGNSLTRYNILSEMNFDNYEYETIPFLTELSEAINLDYLAFLNNFNKTIVVNDEAGSFAMYKLSGYMAKHLDFTRARKMAALSLRYNSPDNFMIVLTENYEKMNWLYRNAEAVKEQFKIHE